MSNEEVLFEPWPRIRPTHELPCDILPSEYQFLAALYYIPFEEQE